MRLWCCFRSLYVSDFFAATGTRERVKGALAIAGKGEYAALRVIPFTLRI